MARCEIADNAAGVIVDANGHPAYGAVMTLTFHGSGDPVPVYAAETGGTLLVTGGPLVSDAEGQLPGWVDGPVKIDVSGMFDGTPIPVSTADFVPADAVGVLAVGSVVSGAADSSLLVTNGSGEIESGPLTASVVTVSSGTAPVMDSATVEVDQNVVYYDAATGKLKGKVVGGLALPSQLFATGHSYIIGELPNPVIDRQTAKLAAALHAVETNFGEPGVNLMDPGSGWGGAIRTGAQWAEINARSAAPYLSPFQAIVLCYGIDDLAAHGLSAVQATFGHCLRYVLNLFRAGSAYDGQHSSVTYTGSWTHTTGGDGWQGTNDFTSTSGDHNQVVVPADFPGGTISLGFMCDPSSHCTITVKEGATTLGTLDTTGIAGSGLLEGCALRLTGLAAGAHTLTITYTAVTGNVYFSYWAIEANVPPVIQIEEEGAYPAGSGNTSPTNMAALSTLEQGICNEYADGRVRFVSTASLISANPIYYISDGTHPNSLGAGVIANAMLSDLLTFYAAHPTDLAYLGTDAPATPLYGSEVHATGLGASGRGFFDAYAYFNYLFSASGQVLVGYDSVNNAEDAAISFGGDSSIRRAAAGVLATDAFVIDGVTWFGYNGNPNSHVTARAKGDMCVDYSTPALWQAGAANNSSWTQIGGGASTGLYKALILGTPGLVSYWRLDEASGTSAADSKGTNAGTYMGGFTLAQPGAIADGDKAVALNGTTGLVSVPDAAALRLVPPFTLEAWILPTDHAASYSILSKSDTSVQRNYEWYLDTTPQLNAVVGGTAVTAGPTVPIGRWCHVALVCDGAYATHYLNGVGTTFPFTGTGATGNHVLELGGWSSASIHLKGSLDEVALYNVALSPAQIAAHYAYGGLS